MKFLNCVCGCAHTHAQGRLTEVVYLTRPLSGGLGFSVVGLSPAGGSSQGVVVKHIQPGGVAHRFTELMLTYHASFAKVYVC